MPLRSEWRRRLLDCNNNENETEDLQDPPNQRQTDEPDAVLLSRRHWAISAERQALNEAVTLVDSLLGLQSPRQRFLNVLLNQREARMRSAASEDVCPESPEERPASMERLFLRTSWDDLCRHRSTHADCDVGLVGSGRMRRQNAVHGRIQSRLRSRDVGHDEEQGTISPFDFTDVFSKSFAITPAINVSGCDQENTPLTTETIRQSVLSQQRVNICDEPSRPSRRPSRPRICRDLMEHASPAEKLIPVLPWQEMPNTSESDSDNLRITAHPAEIFSPFNTSVESVVAEIPVRSETSVTRLKKSEDVQEMIRNQLECPVCLDYLCPPIKQCANGHCVCSACSPRLSHCATCRANFISTPNVVLENLVRSLCFPCRYREEGCNEILKMDQRPGHEEDCPFRPRKCPTACCDWHGLPGELKLHITSSHKHYILNLDELREFAFCVDRNDGVPTIVHDEQFVLFVDSDMFVFESHYDLWRSKFFAELRQVGGDAKTTGIGIRQDGRRYAYDVELFTRTKNVHLKLRNLVEDETKRSTAIKIDLDVFNQFVNDGQYTLHMRIVAVEEEE